MKRIDKFVIIGGNKLSFAKEEYFYTYLDALRRIHSMYKDVTDYFECYPDTSEEKITDEVQYAAFRITGLNLTDAHKILNSPAFKLCEQRKEQDHV